MSDDQRAELQREVDVWRRHFNLGCKLWSAANHGALLVATFSTAAAAVLLKTNLPSMAASQKSDWAALLAIVGSFITGISTFAGADRKWRANRLGRGKMNQLRIDLMDPAANLAAVRAALKDALEAEDKHVLGIAVTNTPTAPNECTPS